MVVLACLWAGHRWLSRYRDWLLVLFVGTTYFLLPVLGFAYGLVIIGLAQCPPHGHWL